MFSRRDVLAATAAGGMMTAATMTTATAAPVKSDITFGNPNDPPQGAINASESKERQRSRPAESSHQGSVSGSIFSTSHRRRQHAAELGIFQQRAAAHSKWRLGASGNAGLLCGCGHDLRRQHAADGGGIREMHWHQFAEWAYMTYGTCRITVLDETGRPYIADVKEGDLWYFPAGLPHSLQGLGPDGCEFIICFDEGKASEFTTLLVSEWFTHTPPDILADNFGVPAETFQDIPLRDLYIFQGKLPGDLAADREAVSGSGCAATPLHLLAWIGCPRARNDGRYGAHRRQPQLHRLDNHRCRAGNGASRRLAGDALAPQRR